MGADLGIVVFAARYRHPEGWVVEDQVVVLMLRGRTMSWRRNRRNFYRQRNLLQRNLFDLKISYWLRLLWWNPLLWSNCCWGGLLWWNALLWSDSWCGGLRLRLAFRLWLSLLCRWYYCYRGRGNRFVVRILIFSIRSSLVFTFGKAAWLISVFALSCCSCLQFSAFGPVSPQHQNPQQNNHHQQRYRDKE